MEREIGNLRIKFFDSKDNMPIKNFRKFNKYVMLDSDVGSTFESFNSRINKAVAFIDKNMNQECKLELENLRQCVYSVFEEYNPSFLSYAVLVRSISTLDKNKKVIHTEEFKDYDDDCLIRIIEQISSQGLKKDELDLLISEVKKKLKQN